MNDTPDTPPEARFAGSSTGGGPQTVAVYGGAEETDQAKIHYLWLEFHPLGVRLRGRRLIGRLVTTCDVRYEQITQLVVLTATTGPRSRGIRLRTVIQSQYIYFFTGPAAVPRLLELFSRHGVRIDGQLTRTRIPYSGGGYIYRENAPIEPLSY